MSDMKQTVMELAVVKVTSLTTNKDGSFITVTSTDDIGERHAFSIPIDSEFTVDWERLREFAGENEFVNIALVKYD